MYDGLLEWYIGVLEDIGLTDVTGITVAGVRHKGDVLSKPEALMRAAEFGQALASGSERHRRERP